MDESSAWMVAIRDCSVVLFLSLWMLSRLCETMVMVEFGRRWYAETARPYQTFSIGLDEPMATYLERYHPP